MSSLVLWAACRPGEPAFDSPGRLWRHVLIFGSVCSGIEAASVAWKPMGWAPAWFSEIDPFCCALLEQRHPGTPNLGDMMGIDGHAGPIDVLVGGTPCQSFSVTGLRKGVDDARGNLALRFVELARHYKPRWILWENVAGVLSSNGGRDFGSIVGALAELGYGWAYRVLDLREWGIPQRRRRLFLVGHYGSDRKAFAALFDERTTRQDGRPAEAPQQADPGLPGVIGWTGDTTPKFGVGCIPTLRAFQGGEGVGIIAGGIARRLTVREWERLQGFPDDYTAIDYRGKPASDNVRCQAVGNSFPVPIVRWIGERIGYLEGIK